MVINTCRNWLLMLVFMLVAGCGWHLQGMIKMNPTLKHIYIQTDQPNAPFALDVKRLLQANQIQVVTAKDDASSILHLNPLKKQNRITSVTGGGEAGQYTITLSTTFKLSTPDNRVLIPSTLIQTSRQYSSNASQVLSSDSKVEALSDTMRQQLANSILNQLANAKVNKNETQSTATQDTP